MRYSILPLILIATACAPTPSDQIMNRIEAQVRMPARAHPLNSYRRYYYRDGPVIIGLYLSSTTPGREWITKEDRRWVLDGGCGVVTVTFSPKTNNVISVDCNGEA